MAGLDPAIHAVPPGTRGKHVDARLKAGHDDEGAPAYSKLILGAFLAEPWMIWIFSHNLAAMSR